MKDTRFERSGTVCPNVGICKKTRSQSRDTFIVLLVQCIGDLGYRAGVITGGYGSGRVSEISSSSDRNPCVSPDGHYVRTTTILWWLNNEDKLLARTEIRYISGRSRSATTTQISRICKMLSISMTKFSFHIFIYIIEHGLYIFRTLLSNYKSGYNTRCLIRRV